MPKLPELELLTPNLLVPEIFSTQLAVPSEASLTPEEQSAIALIQETAEQAVQNAIQAATEARLAAEEAAVVAVQAQRLSNSAETAVYPSLLANNPNNLINWPNFGVIKTQEIIQIARETERQLQSAVTAAERAAREASQFAENAQRETENIETAINIAEAEVSASRTQTAAENALSRAREALTQAEQTMALAEQISQSAVQAETLFEQESAESSLALFNSIIVPEQSQLEVDLLSSGEGRRMTGGGTIGKTDTTHGFELRCNVNELPNNLEINWFGRGRSLESHRFHLENLASAVCSDNPAINEEPPVAGFDTYVGAGVGRYDGVSGATIEFILTDAGEPGEDDFAKVLIKDSNGNIVLDISGNLRFGNHQAH